MHLYAPPPAARAICEFDFAAAAAEADRGHEDCLRQSLQKRYLLGKVDRLSSRLLRDKLGAFFVKQSVDLEIGAHELKASAALSAITRVFGLPPFFAAPVDFDANRTNCVMFFENIGQSLEDWLYDPTGGGYALLKRSPRRFSDAVDAVVTQVVLALSLLQGLAGYHHNDLHTRNVCVRESAEWSVAFDLDGETRCYVFPSLRVGFADQEFATMRWRGGALALPRCSFAAAMVSNVANNCFDLWRFCTSTFLRKRPQQPLIFEHLSPALKNFLQQFDSVRHHTQARDWFPYLSCGPTPTDCCRSRLAFMERFRSPGAAGAHFRVRGRRLKAFEIKEKRSSPAPLLRSRSLSTAPSEEVQAFVQRVAAKHAKSAHARASAKDSPFDLGAAAPEIRARFFKFSLTRAQRVCRLLYEVAAGGAALNEDATRAVERAVDYVVAAPDFGVKARDAGVAVPADFIPEWKFRETSENNAESMSDAIYAAAEARNYVDKL